MTLFQRILVGTTNTEADHDLLRYAAQVARLCGTRLVRFAHVLPHGTDGSEGDNAASARDQALPALEEMVRAHFSGTSPETQSAIDVLKGPLVDRLLEFAAEQEADLVLVGHRRSQKGRRALARRLAMNAPCSVWMVPEDSPAVLRHVLVPVDFSEHAAHALRLGASLAHLAGAAKCSALHVTPIEPELLHEELDTFLQGREKEAMRELVASVDAPDIRIEALFEQGRDTSETVLRVAVERQADLIVMGTRGRSRSAAILLGSAVEQTIIASRIPVLAVKEFGVRLGLLEALLDKVLPRPLRRKDA